MRSSFIKWKIDEEFIHKVYNVHVRDSVYYHNAFKMCIFLYEKIKGCICQTGECTTAPESLACL